MYIVAVKDERGGLIAELRLDAGDIKLGRSKDNDVCLVSDSVSRQHACIYISGQAYVADMGSSNGVYVSDRRIQREAAVDEKAMSPRQFNRLGTGQSCTIISTGVNTAVYTPTDAHGKLVIVSGPQVGREILMFDPSARWAELMKMTSTPDVSISRHHARLHKQDDGSYVLRKVQATEHMCTVVGLIDRFVYSPASIHLEILNVFYLRLTVFHNKARYGRWVIYGLLVVLAPDRDGDFSLRQ